ncbi:MAG: GNAT family N-acetyltransferase [Caldilineaceae bacterium]
MGAILPDLSTQALIAAIEDNLIAFFRNSTRAEIHDDPELLWWITDRPFGFDNMLFRARLTPETADGAVAAAIARAKARNVSLLWWVGPATQPSTLGQTLASHGFLQETVPGMAVDLQTLPPDGPVAGLAIEQVRSEETLRQWCELFVAGYGMPSESVDGWYAGYTGMDFAAHHFLRHYIGSIAGVPVATSLLCLAAGVAGIYCVATLPDYRRRGIGAAMTLAPLRAAQAEGYRVGILQASEMGCSVYARMGFEEYCKIEMYGWT